MKITYFVLIASLFLILKPAYTQDAGLLVNVQVRDVISRPDQVGTQRSRHAAINFNALTRGTSNITLNLFDDVNYVAVNKRIEPRPLGRDGYIWIGTLQDIPHSNVILVVTDEFIDGRILLPGLNYYIAPTSTHGIHTVSEINTFHQRPTPEQDDAVVADVVPDEMDVVPQGVRIDDGSLIDVMVVYTPAAVAFVGGVENMEAAVEGAVTLANITYENSQINFRLRLVHTTLVDYVENPDSGSDLDELSSDTDGQMDNVHALRDTYAADLVTLIAGTSVEERNYCGIAWLPPLPNDEQAFSIVEALCISDITYAHELGHNMGSAHDRANGSGGRTYYSFGYQNPRTGPDDWGDFVTVMAYSTRGECPPQYQPGVCPAIAYWSNPDMTFNGKSLGHPDHQTNATNNTRSLNEVAFAVANYRISADGGVPTITPIPTTTYTPSPIPTSTNAPTATPVEGSELLLNGGFEIDADADNVPDGWRGIGLSKDQRLCKKAYSGTCVFRFKGRAGESSKLSQTIGAYPFQSGDILTLSAYVRSSAISGGAKLQLIVKYPTLPPDKLNLPIPAGLSDYTLLSDSLVLNAEVAKVKVMIKYQNPAATGQFFIDGVSLSTIRG